MDSAYTTGKFWTAATSRIRAHLIFFTIQIICVQQLYTQFMYILHAYSMHKFPAELDNYSLLLLVVKGSYIYVYG